MIDLTFKEKLGHELVFFDGAMGTLLFQSGLSVGELPETWNLSHPDVVRSIHRCYVEAGCNVITTNTFGANQIKLGGSCYDIIRAAVENAKAAGAEYTALDIGPTGKLLKPFGDLSFDDAYNAFAEAVKAGNGADLILIETMSDIYESKAALLAAKENSDLPVVITFSFDERGLLLTGGDIPAAVALAESLGADAIGLNCGLGPDMILPLARKMLDFTSLPLVVNPNAGLPTVKYGKTVYSVTPSDFAEKVEKIVDAGACAVGGCCGTTPEHISALINLCSGKKVSVKAHDFTVVSSGIKATFFGKKPLIIGERINPTGKPRLKAALRENNMTFISREAISQTDLGADILDVNVGLPEINEPEMMEAAILNIQSVTDLPLQIDSSDPVAIERALRVYNGKPLVNSVNGSRESMDMIFPLVKKYGAAVVALTLDENGIPDTSEGRVAIAEKIILEAEKYGIPRKNIIIDTLAMTISTGQNNAEIAINALSCIKNCFGVHTVLGVSNISFGLPCREKINSTFFAAALSHGLSAGIINPSSEAMMDTYRSFCALNGSDGSCEKFIAKYSTATPVTIPTTASEMNLRDAVCRGMIELSELSAAKLLETMKPLDIINEYIVPALDEIGIGFEKGTVFLPQLLMSADAAKAAFDAVKAGMKSGESVKKNNKIVLATVKGDIHDIGKNIVKVLLENYGFEVIDLGRDVSPENVLAAVTENSIKLVGLSALMTTTVVNMEATIRLLHENGCTCKIMVGGAVLTEKYAKSIGADFYSKDAMGSVRYACELLD